MIVWALLGEISFMGKYFDISFDQRDIWTDFISDFYSCIREKLLLLKYDPRRYPPPFIKSFHFHGREFYSANKSWMGSYEEQR